MHSLALDIQLQQRGEVLYTAAVFRIKVGVLGSPGVTHLQPLPLLYVGLTHKGGYKAGWPLPLWEGPGLSSPLSQVVPPLVGCFRLHLFFLLHLLFLAASVGAIRLAVQSQSSAIATFYPTAGASVKARDAAIERKGYF